MQTHVQEIMRCGEQDRSITTGNKGACITQMTENVRMFSLGSFCLDCWFKPTRMNMSGSNGELIINILVALTTPSALCNN